MPELREPIIPPQSQDGMPLPEEQILLAVPPVVEDPPESTTAIDELSAYLSKTNIAEDVDDDVLKEMGEKCVEGYDIDLASREEWEKMLDTALELAKQTITPKTIHGETVSNVKYPALSTATIQFLSRALPNIIKGKDVVKGKVVGLATPPELPEDLDPENPEDAERGTKILKQQIIAKKKWAKADRIGTFMSYQFLDEIDDWQDDLDQLLAALPIAGVCFRKTYYDTVGGNPLSPYVSAKDLVVNYNAKSLKTASRATHVLEFTPNEIEEKVRGEIFLDVELGDPEPNEDPRDDDAPHEFLEQHTWWDLNDDGYKEPYVITIHKKTKQVVRMVPRYDADGIIADEKGDIIRIIPVQYFTRFLFMPAFDGNFYGMGYGVLMSHMNATINDIINLLLDSGKRATMGGGWIGKGLSLGKKAVIYLKSGEWKHVSNTGDDLRKGIVPAPTSEPSNVLFQLLGLLLEASKEIGSQSDVLAGSSQGANASPTTTLALIEQGLMVHSAVHKRLHRALKAEYQKVRRLNRLYLEEDHYRTVLDDPKADVNDFYEKDIDVVPISDETELTHVQKLIKAEALIEKKGTGFTDREIDKRYLEALEIPDQEKLLPPENAEPPEDPQLEIDREANAIKQQEADNDRERVEIEKSLAAAKIRKSDADTERTKATADETRAKALTDEHNEKLDSLTKVVQELIDGFSKLADKVVKGEEEKEKEKEKKEKSDKS